MGGKFKPSTLLIWKKRTFYITSPLPFSMLYDLWFYCAQSDCGNGQVSYGRRKRETTPAEPKTKEVPLQLAIVVRPLSEQEEMVTSQNQINVNHNNNNNNNSSERASRRLEASGSIRTTLFLFSSIWTAAPDLAKQAVVRDREDSVYNV